MSRPGIIFVTCVWLHTQMVWLLALQEATEADRAAFNRTKPPFGRHSQVPLGWAGIGA